MLRSDDMLAVDFESTAVSEGRAKQTGSFFYLKDALGSVKELTDSSGNIQQRYGYSSFGELISVTDASGSDISDDPMVDPYFTYTGREYDKESGLYYYRARYYSPEIGRFIQADPDPGKLGSPVTTNSKYIYVGNNPLKNIDPSGEAFFTAFVVGALVGVAMNEVFDMEFSVFQAALLGGVAGYAASATVGGISGIGSLPIGQKILTSSLIGFAAGSLASIGTSLGLALLTQNETFSDNFDQAAWLGGGVGAITGIGFTFFKEPLKNAVAGRKDLLLDPVGYFSTFPGDGVALGLFAASEFFCEDISVKNISSMSCRF